MFKADLVAIDKMRSDAVNVRDAHGSELMKLGAYAAVLSAASGKFPVDVRGSAFRSSWGGCILTAVLNIIDRCRFYMVSCIRIQHPTSP